MSMELQKNMVKSLRRCFLDILLIPRFGIVGAAWATTVAYGVTVIFLISMAKRKLGFAWSSILFARKSDIQWLLSKQKQDHSIDSDLTGS